MDICLPGAPGAPVLNAARAAASRANGAPGPVGERGPNPSRPGARSRGPKTPEGKARSAQNALKHGMRAQQCIVLPGERASAFDAFEAALIEELAPEGALQSVLAQRVVAASWRLARSERLEAELFAQNMLAGHGLGLALLRDGNGARAFDTLLRYRGTTLAELWRALRTLKALQAEAAAPQAEQAAAGTGRAGAAPPEPPLVADPREMPIKPESRGNPHGCAPPPAASLRCCHATGRPRARDCQTNPSAAQTLAVPHSCDCQGTTLTGRRPGRSRRVGRQQPPAGEQAFTWTPSPGPGPPDRGCGFRPGS